MYAIGLNTYLELGVDASHLHASYPRHATRGTFKPAHCYVRDCHPLWCAIPGDFYLMNYGRKKGQPHLQVLSYSDSVCSLLCSVALTNSISIDFFSCRYWDVSIPCVPCHIKWPIRKSYSEIFGSTATYASPKHFVVCHILHKRLSQVIHLIS